MKLFFAADSTGDVQLLESLLLLSAEMDDGLGLLVATRPHRKTAAQLLERVYDPTHLFKLAVSTGHASFLQWLSNSNLMVGDANDANDADVVMAAATHGHVSVLNGSRASAGMDPRLRAFLFALRFLILCFGRYIDYFTATTCNIAAFNGRLDALKYLRTELHCEWRPSDVLEGALERGQVHVLDWAIENGGPLVLSDAEKSVALHTFIRGRTRVLEWLLAVHPPILEQAEIEDVFLSAHHPDDARILELLASHFGPAKVMEVMQSRLVHNLYYYSYLVPSVMAWLMQQGMQFGPEFFDRMMHEAAESRDVPELEHYLRLGGKWRAQYFHAALASDRLTFCQWAHKRGDLELGFDDLPSTVFQGGSDVACLGWCISAC